MQPGEQRPRWTAKPVPEHPRSCWRNALPWRIPPGQPSHVHVAGHRTVAGRIVDINGYADRPASISTQGHDAFRRDSRLSTDPSAVRPGEGHVNRLHDDNRGIGDVLTDEQARGRLGGESRGHGMHTSDMVACPPVEVDADDHFSRLDSDDTTACRSKIRDASAKFPAQEEIADADRPVAGPTQEAPQRVVGEFETGLHDGIS